MPVLAGGVIDLVFREAEGWVIVDYKTDRVRREELAGAVAHYGRQVQLYAEVWARATGEPVHERGLYFTSLGRYVRVEARPWGEGAG